MVLRIAEKSTTNRKATSELWTAHSSRCPLKDGEGGGGGGVLYLYTCVYVYVHTRLNAPKLYEEYEYIYFDCYLVRMTLRFLGQSLVR